MGKKHFQSPNYLKNMKINLHKRNKLAITKTLLIYQPAITMMNEAKMTVPS